MDIKIVLATALVIAFAAPLAATIDPTDVTAAISEEVKAYFSEQFSRHVAELKEENKAQVEGLKAEVKELEQKVDKLERALKIGSGMAKIDPKKPAGASQEGKPAALAGTCVSCESTSATGSHASAIGYSTNASGWAAVAMGSYTHASGHKAVAMGENTNAPGGAAVAMGFQTNAKGQYSLAMGAGTTAKGEDSLAMGRGAETTEDESLVSSGIIHGRNMFIHADERLVANTTTASPTRMLSSIRQLRVVEYGHSKNVCCHSHNCSAECEHARRVGLIGQEVELAMPGATSSGSSLKLMKPRAPHDRKNPAAHEVLEHVRDVHALDVHALLAAVVGAIQHLSQLHDELAGRVM